MLFFEKLAIRQYLTWSSIRVSLLLIDVTYLKEIPKTKGEKQEKSNKYKTLVEY